MAKYNIDGIFDAELELKSTAEVTSSAAEPKIVQLGKGVNVFDIILNVTDCKVSDGDERYDIELQFSTSPTFASDTIVTSTISFGAAAVLSGDKDVTAGRSRVHQTNLFNDVAYPYVRLKNVVSGTSPSITYNAYITRRI